MSERITGAELARRLGVSKPAITKAVKAGRLTPGDDGKFEYDAAIADFRLNTRRGRNPSGVESAAPRPAGIAEAELEKVIAHTEWIKLRNAKLAGELVDRDVAERETSRLALEFRDRFLAFCRREAAQVHAVARDGDVGDVRRYLDKQARLELESMSDGVMSLVASGDDSDEDAGPDSEDVG